MSPYGAGESTKMASETTSNRQRQTALIEKKILDMLGISTNHY